MHGHKTGYAVLLIVLAAGIGLSPLGALTALAQTPAFPISVSPTTSSPGMQVLVQGNWTLKTAGVYLLWDALDGSQIGWVAPEDISRAGTFAVQATIPPDATPGPHAILAWDPNIQASAKDDITIQGSALKAAYVHGDDGKATAAYLAFLSARARLAVEAIPVGQLEGMDLSQFSLIIIGPDTGSLGVWGTAGAQKAVAASGVPVLALGEGGYAFFGGLRLRTGWPNGARQNIGAVVEAEGGWEVFSHPYAIPGEALLFPLTTPAVSIYAPKQLPGMLRVGQAPGEPEYFNIVQEKGRYLFWGYEAPPLDSTRVFSDELMVNAIWYLLRLRLNANTLILVDYQRMQDIGYSAADVAALEARITTLVGLPYGNSNMTAIVRRLNVDPPVSVRNARTTWDANEDSVAGTNAYVAAIDGYIEGLKQGLYPKLTYVILVGSHEVIPQKARDTDDMASHPESSWAAGLPQTSGYFYSLYHDPGANNLGHYLTDSVYGDLSYIDNGRGVDNELIPELGVGRLVETPAQITTLLDNYMAAGAILSRAERVSIGSYDYMDGAQAAADHMGAGTDTSLIQSTFNTTLVPTRVNENPNLVYLAGHGNYNYIAPGFVAGASASAGDTEEFNNLPDAVVITSGCHNGVNFGDMLYHAYTSNTTYGEFPERMAAHQVGVYLGASGYTWISGSGTSTNVANNGWNERLATHTMDHLLNDGMFSTPGKAFIAAVSQYVTEYGGVGDPHRRVLAIATLYGMPTYTWPKLYYMVPFLEYAYNINIIKALLGQDVSGQVATTEQISLTVNDWDVAADGLVTIPGAAYTGDFDEPILPVITSSRLLPHGAAVLGVTWNEAASTSVVINNDVPLAQMAVLDTKVTNPFSATDFWPMPLYRLSIGSTAGGEAIQVDLAIMPVQYNPATHQTRVWTKLAFELRYDAEESELVVDSDADGLPDYWEAGYGLDPFDPAGDQGATGDPDQDGLNNTGEFQLGTDPLNPDSDRDQTVDGVEAQSGLNPLNPGSRMEATYLPLVTSK